MPSDIGVITACDPAFFPGFQLLFHSLRGVPVTLFDLGLSPLQRAWCEERSIPLMTIPLRMHTAVYGWQSWNKPLYLAASPYKYTLWMDCDCVARSSLMPLFDALKEKPLIMRHWNPVYYQPNDNVLYERFPTLTRFASKRLINAGVIGICKSRDLDSIWFRTWRDMVKRAMRDADLQARISFWDEGALIWALEATASVEIVTDRQAWNYFVTMEDVGGMRGLMRALPTPSDQAIWHFSGPEKPWSDLTLRKWMLPDDALDPFDFKDYAHVWKIPEWSLDRRHILWLYDVLVSGRIRTALEIGSLYGAASSAFVEAVNSGQLHHATFCDTIVTSELRRTVDRCVDQRRVRIFEGTSLDLLDEGERYDLVFIDGDHRLETVNAEMQRLLRVPPSCIVAHDTSATGAGIADCEGPASLKQMLQRAGWLCLEDAVPRRDERTHRGLFFATTDPVLYDIVRGAMACRCDVTSAYLSDEDVPMLPPKDPPANWRQLFRDARKVLAQKRRKGWLW